MEKKEHKGSEVVAKNKVNLDQVDSLWFDTLLANNKNFSRISEIDASIFEFQGFDPLKTMRALVDKHNGIKDATFESFMKDIFCMIMIVSIRGTNFESRQITEKSTEDLNNLIAELVEKYDIKPNADGATSRTITLARVAALFPEMVALFLLTGRARMPYVSTEIPPVFHFAGAVALMNEKTFQAMGNAYLSYMVKFTQVISQRNEKLKNVKEADLYKRQKTIIQAQLSSVYNKTRFGTMVGRIKTIGKVIKPFALNKTYFEKEAGALLKSLMTGEVIVSPTMAAALPKVDVVEPAAEGEGVPEELI